MNNQEKEISSVIASLLTEYTVDDIEPFVSCIKEKGLYNGEFDEALPGCMSRHNIYLKGSKSGMTVVFGVKSSDKNNKDFNRVCNYLRNILNEPLNIGTLSETILIYLGSVTGVLPAHSLEGWEVRYNGGNISLSNSKTPLRVEYCTPKGSNILFISG